MTDRFRCLRRCCCSMVGTATAASVCGRAGHGGQWGPTLVVFALASLLKLLVLAPGVYHSTDFEVSPHTPMSLSSYVMFARAWPFCTAVGGLVQEPPQDVWRVSSVFCLS